MIIRGCIYKSMHSKRRIRFLVINDSIVYKIKLDINLSNDI